MSEPTGDRRHPVTPLELFFDLVFVFGFTQVTTVLSDTPTWSGLAHGLLILAALWWVWAAYAWLTNTVDAGVGLVWGAILVAMAAMFVAALAVPDAFDRHGVVFGVAFLVVNVMHLSLYALASRADRDLLKAILRAAPSTFTGAALIVAAGFAGGSLKPVLWLVAVGIGLFGPLLGGMRGWRVQPAHFVERHGLIVIIAIGESLIAIGLGERHTALGVGVIVAAVLGFLVAASFWLAYFDFFPIRAEQLLSDRSGTQRITLARDVYTYLHLPMVAGIVLFAFAMRATLAQVGRPARHGLGIRSLRRVRAVSAGLRGAPPARGSHTRRRPPDRRDRLRSPVAGRRGRAGNRRARPRRRGLGRPSRLRDHLVARGSRTDTRTPHAKLDFLNRPQHGQARGPKLSDPADVARAPSSYLRSTENANEGGRYEPLASEQQVGAEQDGHGRPGGGRDRARGPGRAAEQPRARLFTRSGSERDGGPLSG